MFDSCLRGRIQRGRLPFRRRSKHTPSSCTQRIIGVAYRKHSGPRIITEFGAYIEEYMQIHSHQPPEEFEEMTATGVRMHSSFSFFFVRVCVFLLILADVMRNISSLAAGHRSGTNRGDCGGEKYFFPLLQLCDISCGPSRLLPLNNKPPPFTPRHPSAVMCVPQTQQIAQPSCGPVKSVAVSTFNSTLEHM